MKNFMKNEEKFLKNEKVFLKNKIVFWKMEKNNEKWKKFLKKRNGPMASSWDRDSTPYGEISLQILIHTSTYR
jgi:hypothetical protein